MIRVGWASRLPIISLLACLILCYSKAVQYMIDNRNLIADANFMLHAFLINICILLYTSNTSVTFFFSATGSIIDLFTTKTAAFTGSSSTERARAKQVSGTRQTRHDPLAILTLSSSSVLRTACSLSCTQRLLLT